MSGLAAAARLDGGPAPRAACEAMLRASPHRAPDGVGTWMGDGVVLALQRQLLLPEQHLDDVPLVHAAAPLALVFDGRLDNRDRLACDFAWDAARAAASDAAYALEAFARWGAGAVDRLDGVFACVLWDGGRRQILAARDRMGVRPLHWARHDGVVFVASDAAQVVSALPAVPEADTSAVADLLSRDPAGDDRTLFRGVYRVPPGAFVTFDAHGVRLTQYWRPEAAAAPRRRSDAEWAGACRDVLDRAVRVRLRARGPVAVCFSGGVDSSVVLAVAHAVRGPAAALLPITVHFDEPESDERGYSAALLASLGVEGRVARPLAPAADVFRAQAARRLTLPDLPADLACAPIKSLAVASGARVALTGVGGDSLFGGSTLVYADLLARGRVEAALARYALDWLTDDSGWTRAGLFTSGVWPLLSPHMRTRLRVPARRLAGVAHAPSWLRLTRPEQPVVPAPPPGVPYASWDVEWGMRGGWTAFFFESSERAASEAGVEERHPLLDPAVVQFALSLPERQRRRGRTTKYVLRRSVPELPQTIARRRIKSDFRHVVLSALQDLGGHRFFRDLAIGEAGWVDPIELSRRYDRLAAPGGAATVEGARDIPALWIVAATELWFRAAFGSAARRARQTVEGAVAG